MRSTIRSTLGLCIFALALASQSVAAQTNVAASMTVDNSFVAYLSTDDTVQGTQIGTGDSWPTTYAFNAALTPGVTNYLHIVATDAGQPAMFIGSFTLSNIGFEFSNGTQSLVTNTVNWLVSETGFGSNYVTPADLGGQGTSPWGNFPAINASARFIWHPVGPDNTVYFSTTINPTGEQPLGTRATFAVTKDFSDDNPTATATVSISCDTGLPLLQDKVINAAAGVTFVVESFESGAMDCDVTEAAVPGYTTADAVFGGKGTGTPSDTATKCTFSDVGDGDAWTCVITNDPTPVEVTVYKDWVIDGQGGNSVEDYYEITLNCGSSEIKGGEFIDDSWRTTFYNSSGFEDDYYTADVVPRWQGNSFCSAYEATFDNAIETTGDCGSNAIHPVLGDGGDDSCTFTNTVFYEGIPTLSQYGMAIMALLMLGVGFVGFRRLV